MDEELKANIKKKSTWIRSLYMILFIVLFYVALMVTGVVVVAQFLSKLLMGKANEQLSSFGHSLGIYLSEIVWFLTFRSEDMPYPCRPWPSKASSKATATASRKKAPARKSMKKKK